MADTTIPVGDPKAVQVWSTKLFAKFMRMGYFKSKFISKSDNAIIQQLTDLEQSAGDTISFDLAAELRGEPTTGDARLEGSEEDLRFYSDEVKIDQTRHAVSSGGKMSQKRTVHNLREIAKNKLAEYWAKYMDELMFIYLSGSRGINGSFIEPTSFTGFAGNTLDAPDSFHQRYGGSATGKGSITTSDVMDRDIIERANTHAKMMYENDPDTANMRPVSVDGGDHYVCVMSPIQEHSLRTASGSLGWAEIQKQAGARGRTNNLFKDSLGMIGNTVLHSHERVIRFSDYGTGSNLPAARALYMGRQAGLIAYGAQQKGRSQTFSWKEEWKDYGNVLGVAAGAIFGLKKARFNSRDFGVMALDTYAKMPT